MMIILLLLASCGPNSEPEGQNLRQVASTYFETYASRKDFPKFMNFYAEDASLSDVLYGNNLHGKAQIGDFFDWNRGEFKISEGPKILEVRSQIISGRTVISRGTFKEFTYNQMEYGPWEFMIWLEFDAKGKIKRQEDWINYSPKKIMVGATDDP